MKQWTRKKNRGQVGFFALAHVFYGRFRWVNVLLG